MSGGINTSAPARVWRDELIGTVKLAGPLALTQLGQIAMMTVDLALIGRLGNSAVAAAALAHSVLFTAFMFGLGLVTAVSPLAAQAFGARKPRLVRRALRVGLWAAVMVGLPLSLLQMRSGDLLIWLGQPADAALLAQRYLDGLAWSLTPAWLFIALRGFMSALNRPEPALWITLAAIPANGVLAYLLIFGAFGLPRLDLLGAGIATTLVSIGMFVAGVWICYASAPFKKYHVLGHIWRSDWPLFRQLIAIGLPISATFLLEHGVFASAALLMGIIGTVALAAHQVALHTAAIVFMVPLGIGMAATVRVGHAVGRGDARCGAPRRLCRNGARRRVPGRDGDLRRARTRANPAAVLRLRRRSRDACAHLDPAPHRHELLYLRWLSGDRRGRAARLQRHARAAPVCRGELLAGGLHVRLSAGFSRRPRRGRGLDRPGAWTRLLRGAAGRALCPPGAS